MYYQFKLMFEGLAAMPTFEVCFKLVFVLKSLVSIECLCGGKLASAEVT